MRSAPARGAASCVRRWWRPGAGARRGPARWRRGGTSRRRCPRRWCRTATGPARRSSRRWVRPRSSAGRGTPRASPSGCRRCRAGPTRRARRGRTRGPGRSSSRGRPPRGVREPPRRAGRSASSMSRRAPSGSMTSRWQLTCRTASPSSATVSTRVGRIRIGSMLARRLLRCRPTRKGRCTQRERTAMARDMVGRSTTCGCGSDLRRTSPPRLDRARCAGGQGDEGVRGRHQHVELLVVQTTVVVVGVAQVVHGEDEGRPALAQHAGQLAQGLRVGRVEAEVQVEEVHPALSRPRRVEQDRWPPRGSGRAVGLTRLRVDQPVHAASAVGGGEVSYVDVTRGHGGDDEPGGVVRVFTERRGGHDAPVPTLLGASRHLPPRGCTAAENVGSTREPQRRPAPARAVAALPRLPRPLRRRRRRVDGQQGRRRRARAADRRRGRRRRPRRRLVRRRRCSASSRATRSWSGWPSINVVVWVVESASEYVASVLWRGLAQGVEHDLRVEAYDHVQHLDLGWHESPARGRDAGHAQRRRQPARAVPRHRRPGDPADRAERAARRGGVRRRVVAAAGAGVPADPAHRRRVAASSSAASSRSTPGSASAVADLSGVLASNLAGIATIKAFTAEDRERDRVRAASAGLPGGQHRRDPLVGGVRAAGPDGDPRRLHLHAAARRLGDPERRRSRSASTRCSSS